MALWNKIFKKEKKEQEHPPGVSASDSGHVVGGTPPGDSAVRAYGAQDLVGVIRLPHLTEKTASSGERGAYVFRVAGRATRVSVRRAVEERYGVRVDAVRIINTPAKERRRGTRIGSKPGFKKAMVSVARGQKIELS